MIFFWHLLIALTFIIALYLGATYSNLRHHISQLQTLRKKIEWLETQQNQLLQPIQNSATHLDLAAPSSAQLELYTAQLHYYKNDFNEQLKELESLKKSVFARTVLFFSKSKKMQFVFTPL